MNYGSEIKNIEGFIRQEHYKEAGNVIGRILECALLEAYQRLKTRIAPNQQRKLLDAEESVASGKRVDAFTLGQLAGLYREGHVMKLMAADSSLQITRALRIPINDLIEIRNRCAHPSSGPEISLEELEYFLSSLKILVLELGMVDAPAAIRWAEADPNPIACRKCKENIDAEFRYCPHCGSRCASIGLTSPLQAHGTVDLGGDYLSCFDDEINGEIFRITAKAQLYDEGSLVVGETWLPGNDRSWRIEGTVSAHGYFYGIYYATDPADRGLGNFFLHILPDRKLEGLWAGYDSMNGQITSGRYSFTPAVQGLTLVKLARVHIPQVLHIADEQLGRGFVRPEDLCVEEQESSHFLGVVAVDQKTSRILGFGLTHVVDPSGIHSFIRWPDEKLPTSLQYAARIGVLKTVAVRSDCQGRGIGYAIVEQSLKELRERGVETYCSIAWKGGESTNIGGVLKNQDFRVDLEIPEYWKADSQELRYNCPQCGAPPCLCTGVILIKEPYG